MEELRAGDPMELTRRQRNDIFDALQTQGVDPRDCELAAFELTADNWPHVVIRHAPTNSMFELSLEPTRYRFKWHVRDGPISGAGNASKDWDDVLEQLGYWAEEVQYVARTPDFWKEMLAAAQQPEASNAPFTPDEQAEISRRLDEIKQLVRENFDLTSEQLIAVEQRLDDAEEASKRLGRKDWMLMFYGAVMSTFITDAVPPGVIQTVVTTVLHGIAHLFGSGGPPPMIST